MRTVIRLAPLVLLSALFDCTSFAPLPANSCGNGVVDVGEDCDTFARGVTACRPPTAQPGACRFDCKTTPCPTGYGCGTDDVCRQPSGKFARTAGAISAGVSRMIAGDFDGDRRQDLVSREPLDPFGISKLRVHYFDGNAALSKTLIVPPALGSPNVVDVNADKRADLVFSALGTFGNAGGIGMMLGQTDRTLSSVAFPTFAPFMGTARVVGAFSVNKSTAFILYVKGALGAALVAADPAGDPKTLTPIPMSADPGESNIATGSFFSDSCGEAVLALPKAAEVLVYPLCTQNTLNERGAADLIHVLLPSGLTVDRGVLVADVNGDGSLDLLVGARVSGVLKTFVAYGTGGHGFSSVPNGAVDNKAAIFRLNTQTMEDFEPGLPLAVGDTNNDGRPDFVTPNQVLTSIRSPSGDAGADSGSGSPLLYFVAGEKLRGVWTDAVIADFNANGYPDVIAGSNATLDLDFFNGNGTEAFSRFSLTTNGPATSFSVGDVDGDYLPDLVFAQGATTGDQLAIAYGRLGGPPNTPVVVGDFPRIVQTITYDPGAPLSNIIVVGRPVDPKDATTSVSILAGTGDRNPLALFGLSHPKVVTDVPYAVVPGPFSKTGNVDVVAVGADLSGGAPSLTFRLWLAKATAAPGATTTPSLSAVDGPQLRDDALPVVQTDAQQGISLLLAQGDLDGDGTPEVVMVTPLSALGDGTNSQLIIARPRGDAKAFDVLDPIPLGIAAATDGQIAVVDVDGDLKLDIVVLTGPPDAFVLVTYWNDGRGGFSAANSTTMNAKGETPTGFAFIGVGADEPPALAYVTPRSVVLAHLDPKTPRDANTFRRETIDKPRNATGIVAADVDGDGVDDLAIADSNNIVILRAQAVLP